VFKIMKFGEQNWDHTNIRMILQLFSFETQLFASKSIRIVDCHFHYGGKVLVLRDRD
jgi:hypothetical protein